MLLALIEIAAAMISKFHFCPCVEMFLPLFGKVFVQMDVKLKSYAYPLWSEDCNDERNASTFGAQNFVWNFIFVKAWSKTFNKCWPLCYLWGGYKKIGPRNHLFLAGVHEVCNSLGFSEKMKESYYCGKIDDAFFCSSWGVGSTDVTLYLCWNRYFFQNADGCEKVKR